MPPPGALQSDPLAAYTRSVLAARPPAPGPPPATIHEACFALTEFVGRLFGSHHKEFLTGHGIKREPPPAPTPAPAPGAPLAPAPLPPRPLGEELVESFRAHLQVNPRLAERQRFWTATEAERAVFKYWRAPTRLAPRGFWAWLRLLFTGPRQREEMLRELRERHAWADPQLEPLPVERARWDALYRRRAECAAQAAKLRAARAALDAALARLEAELQRISAKVQALSDWKTPSNGAAEIETAVLLQQFAADLAEETAGVAGQITARLASIAQTRAA